jgi:alditol oxidase
VIGRPGGAAEKLTNWAGNVTFAADRVHRPGSVAQLQRLVAGATRVRALGTGHSFNRIADSAGDLISVAGLPPEVSIEPSQPAATVSGGMRYGEVVTHLHRAGFALPSLASLPHLSVAGACATGTHGSGDRLGNLATAVSALEMVTADGDLVRLSRQADGDRFRGAVVGLGALGVVTRLTLDLVPAFEVRQDVYQDLPMEVLVERGEEIFASAYSVSVFTCWRRPVADQVWRKSLADQPAARPARWLGARLADGPRHPVPGAAAAHCTRQLGVSGPWHLRLPHFRLGFTPSSGQELQSEYLIPRGSLSAALIALDAVRDRIAPALQVCELRTVAADELWLSPCYRRDSAAVHFTWTADQQVVAPAMAAVEQALAPLAARPHWGKLFGIPTDVVRDLYPRLPDFANLARGCDPAGKFRNDFVSGYLSF